MGIVSTISETDSKPWLILGDLNKLSSSDKKVLLVEVTLQGTIILITLLIKKNLICLGFAGNPFTWHRKWE